MQQKPTNEYPERDGALMLVVNSYEVVAHWRAQRKRGGWSSPPYV
jgi:hypothetical protein